VPESRSLRDHRRLTGLLVAISLLAVVFAKVEIQTHKFLE